MEHRMSDTETALIVGAGPGLGAALARRFKAAGMTVAVARRRADELRGLAQEIDGHAFACDATDADAVAALFEGVAAALGPPELVVYNAGAFRPGSVLEIEARDFETCWRVGWSSQMRGRNSGAGWRPAWWEVSSCCSRRPGACSSSGRSRIFFPIARPSVLPLPDAARW